MVYIGGGQIGGWWDVLHFTDSEGHTLTDEEGEVSKVGDCDVSACSLGNTHAGIEVEDKLGRIRGEHLPMVEDYQELTSLPLSWLKRAAVVGVSCNLATMAAALAASET